MNKTEINIIIVEDEGLIAHTIKNILESFGYNVVGVFYKYKHALEAVNTLDFDLLITDINLGYGIELDSGISLAKHVKQIKNCPIIFLTAFGDTDTIKKATMAKPSAYLIKPIHPASLYASVQIALEKYINANAEVADPNGNAAVDYFYVKLGVKLIKIKWEDVYALEAIKNYVKICTAQYPSGVLIRSSLQQVIEHNLPIQVLSNFVKISRSTLLIKKCILNIQEENIVTEFGNFKCNKGFNLDIL
jgi:DNA-binding response OmpR family regulator